MIYCFPKIDWLDKKWRLLQGITLETIKVNFEVNTNTASELIVLANFFELNLTLQKKLSAGILNFLGLNKIYMGLNFC